MYETLTQIPKAIRADEKWLRQVLINLLGNAVKFSEKGFITFKVGYQQEKFRFQVEDTGIAIVQEQLAEIFLPFQQGGEKSRETEFANHLRQLAKDFEDEEILKFVQQYKRA